MRSDRRVALGSVKPGTAEVGAVTLAGHLFGCPGYLRGEQKPFQTLKGCHLQSTFCIAVVATRPGGMCFLEKNESGVKLSAEKKRSYFFFFKRSPPTDFKVLLKVTTAGLVHGTSGAVIYCASSHWHARMDGRSNTQTQCQRQTHHHHHRHHHAPLPLCALEVLPVFKSSLRPLSVDKSDGWRGGRPLVSPTLMSHWGSRCACARNSEPDRIYFVQFGLLDSLPKCLKIKNM